MKQKSKIKCYLNKVSYPKLVTKIMRKTFSEREIFFPKKYFYFLQKIVQSLKQILRKCVS